MDLVSLYVDQVGPGDLSRSRGEQFPSTKTYPTITEALRLGGSKLAVDGLVVVGEHVHLHRAPAAMAKAPAGNSAAAV